MTVFVAMLRSINVGGRNKVAMADLASLVISLGFAEVSTYVQSGNVVFRGSGAAAAAGRAIGQALADQLSVTVPVLVRTEAQLAQVVRSCPDGDRDADLKTRHVTFFDRSPSAGAVRSLAADAARFAPDRVEVVGDVAYLVCPGGYGVTTLHNTYLERRLEVTATTRNWRTVTTLANRARDLSAR